MMYAVTSLSSVGCTFLDWSIHFLSNQNHFFNVDKGLISLTHNPLTEKNAHAHEKNQPANQAKTEEFIDVLKKQSNTLPLTSIYPVSSAGSLEYTSWDNVEEYLIDEFNKCLLTCKKEGLTTILVGSPTNNIYNNRIREIPRWFKQTSATEEIFRDLQFKYFFDAQQKESAWSGLDNTWNKREFIALNWRPLSHPFEKFDLYGRTMNNVDFYIDPNDLWFNGEVILKQVLNLLSLKLDEARLAKWLPIYHEWQKIHIKSLRLDWNLDHIINCIIKGLYFDLTSLDLSIMDEATILHVLIYKHNLNIKGYGVDKFIDTKQLHELLEENIHDIKSI